MKYLLVFILLTFVVVLIISTGKVKDTSIVQEVDAVFWHEHNRFSVMYLEKEEIIIKELPRIKISLYEGTPTRYECVYSWSNLTGMDDSGYCSIYISSLEALQTGSWNHGKLDSGTTTRIK